MEDRGSVVVTGASTGIGYATALRLDALGFKVFAGVRNSQDANNLTSTATANLRPIFLELAEHSSIEQAVSDVLSETPNNNVAGLVNNAGFALVSPLEFVPLDEFRNQIEVNVTGHLALTQLLLQYLRAERVGDSKPGRIVNMSSFLGRISLPFAGSYNASKFAVEALSDALRLELKPWGIDLVLIEPGVVNTPIWRKSEASTNALLNSSPAKVRRLYGSKMAIVNKHMASPHKVSATTSHVAGAVAHALTTPRPRTRYTVGLDARLGTMAAHLPARIRDWLTMTFLLNDTE